MPRNPTIFEKDAPFVHPPGTDTRETMRVTNCASLSQWEFQLALISMRAWKLPRTRWERDSSTIRQIFRPRPIFNLGFNWKASAQTIRVNCPFMASCALSKRRARDARFSGKLGGRWAAWHGACQSRKKNKKTGKEVSGGRPTLLFLYPVPGVVFSPSFIPLRDRHFPPLSHENLPTSRRWK